MAGRVRCRIGGIIIVEIDDLENVFDGQKEMMLIFIYFIFSINILI